MPRVPQAPPPGIVRNATPEATPGRWFDCNLVRFRGGQLQPIGGNVAIVGSGVSDLPRDMLTWHDNSRVRWAAFGTDTKLYVYRFDTQVLTDITPAGVGALDPPGALDGYGLGDYGAAAYGTSRDPSDIGPQDIAATMGDMWSMDTFGEDLLVVPTQDGHLYRWSPLTPTAPAALVTGAPDQNRGVIVTDQRHVVLIGAGGDPRMVAWSDQENPDVWAADVTNLAGDKLLQTQSYAMVAKKVSDGLLIFTGGDLHKMTYVGAPFAYGIVQIASGCGPISPRAVAGVGSLLAWPGTQTFWSYQGTVQPLHCDVMDWFFSLVNRSMVGRIFGSPNPSLVSSGATGRTKVRWNATVMSHSTTLTHPIRGPLASARAPPLIPATRLTIPSSAALWEMVEASIFMNTRGSQMGRLGLLWAKSTRKAARLISVKGTRDSM